MSPPPVYPCLVLPVFGEFIENFDLLKRHELLVPVSVRPVGRSCRALRLAAHPGALAQPRARPGQRLDVLPVRRSGAQRPPAHHRRLEAVLQRQRSSREAQDAAVESKWLLPKRGLLRPEELQAEAMRAAFQRQREVLAQGVCGRPAAGHRRR